ncbi:MAG TPA: D-sedoheptulose 7-phosphate isomerase [Candidatus Sulfotelmatobacter sp.]|jgi:D-sedoheptulose 7-phosphate isomerase
MKLSQTSDSMRALIQERIQSSIATKQKLLADSVFEEQVALVAAKIVESLRRGGKVFFFGNGGSAADAQHLAAEFTGRYLKERRPLPALALSVNSSSLTAIGNDYGFEQVFARQLEALGKEGDVAVGITTSGNSPNVVKALEMARTKSIFAVALTGAAGEKADKVADCAICIPSKETPRIQECHILTGHLICEIVEAEMFGNEKPAKASLVFETAGPQAAGR